MDKMQLKKGTNERPLTIIANIRLIVKLKHNKQIAVLNYAHQELGSCDFAAERRDTVVAPSTKQGGCLKGSNSRDRIRRCR